MNSHVKRCSNADTDESPVISRTGINVGPNEGCI